MGGSAHPRLDSAARHGSPSSIAARHPRRGYRGEVLVNPSISIRANPSPCCWGPYRPQLSSGVGRGGSASRTLPGHRPGTLPAGSLVASGRRPPQPDQCAEQPEKDHRSLFRRRSTESRPPDTGRDGAGGRGSRQPTQRSWDATEVDLTVDASRPGRALLHGHPDLNSGSRWTREDTIAGIFSPSSASRRPRSRLRRPSPGGLWDDPRRDRRPITAAGARPRRSTGEPGCRATRQTSPGLPRAAPVFGQPAWASSASGRPALVRPRRGLGPCRHRSRTARDGVLDAFRGVVVVRGGACRWRRANYFRCRPQISDESTSATAPQRPDQPLERGPEITEVRQWPDGVQRGYSWRALHQDRRSGPRRPGADPRRGRLLQLRPPRRLADRQMLASGVGQVRPSAPASPVQDVQRSSSISMTARRFSCWCWLGPGARSRGIPSRVYSGDSGRILLPRRTSDRY